MTIAEMIDKLNALGEQLYGDQGFHTPVLARIAHCCGQPVGEDGDKSHLGEDIAFEAEVWVADTGQVVIEGTCRGGTEVGYARGEDGE